MSLELTIVTPEGETFSGEVEQVVLPGSEGDFGVLEGHERFLSPLNHGALEIIEELEQHPRGVYCGALGFIDHDGGLSLAVAIRTATVAEGRVCYWAGGGIVEASDPDREVAETELKARVFLDAVETQEDDARRWVYPYKTFSTSGLARSTSSAVRARNIESDGGRSPTRSTKRSSHTS